MPRLPTFRNAIAALTMAVAALCGGGKAAAEQKGTLSIVEVKANAALRPDARKKAGETLRDWLQARRSDWVVRTKSGGPIAIWSPDGIGDALSDLPADNDVGFHKVAKVAQSDLQKDQVPAGHVILPDATHPDRLYAIEAKAFLDSGNVTVASAAFDQNSVSVVSFLFTSEGGRRFGDWTLRSVGELFSIVVDGEVVSSPMIREPILGGSGQISGSFTVEQTAIFAARLSSSLEGVDFVVKTTCPAARPRAPPNKLLAWLAPVPTCV